MKRNPTYIELKASEWKAEELGRNAQNFEHLNEAAFHDEAVGGYMTMVRMVGIAAFICAFVGATHLAYSYAISDPMEVVD